MRSGRAGGGRDRGWLVRWLSHARFVGGHLVQPREDPIHGLLVKLEEAATVFHDDQTDLPPQRVSRHDTEEATNICDNGAGGTATDLSRDVFGCGQIDDPRIDFRGGLVSGRDGAWLAAGWRALGIGRCGRLADWATGHLGFKCCGEVQAAGDASQDASDVGGAEAANDAGEVGGGGALLQPGGELFAVEDQGAEDAEEAAGAGGSVRRCGGRPIRIGGLAAGGRLGRHAEIMNIKATYVKENIHNEGWAPDVNHRRRGWQASGLRSGQAFARHDEAEWSARSV